ncbi:MAG: type IV pilin protein [Burkholderiales bacterium]|nr:type IV pilin protein [Burkholderiales bacterium]
MNLYKVFNPAAPKRRGFTLMELMVAVAIVGILSAIAYPSYLSYLIKSRRASAQSYLLDIAQRQQQYLLDARSYTNDVNALNLTTPKDVAPYYTVDVTKSDSPPAFTATAKPIPGSPQASDVTLTIDNTGKKTPDTKW